MICYFEYTKSTCRTGRRYKIASTENGSAAVNQRVKRQSPPGRLGNGVPHGRSAVSSGYDEDEGAQILVVGPM
jgi:hypothetical protein